MKLDDALCIVVLVGVIGFFISPFIVYMFKDHRGWKEILEEKAALERAKKAAEERRLKEQQEAELRTLYIPMVAHEHKLDWLVGIMTSLGDLDWHHTCVLLTALAKEYKERIRLQDSVNKISAKLNGTEFELSDAVSREADLKERYDCVTKSCNKQIAKLQTALDANKKELDAKTEALNDLFFSDVKGLKGQLADAVKRATIYHELYETEQETSAKLCADYEEQVNCYIKYFNLFTKGRQGIWTSFISTWSDRASEKRDCHPFWIALVQTLMLSRGIDYYGDIVSAIGKLYFECDVKLKATSQNYIDLYAHIGKNHVLVEQKGGDVNLDNAQKQSDGASLTPFQQAMRYYKALYYDPLATTPNYIVLCNFKEFRVFDMSVSPQNGVYTYVKVTLDKLDTMYDNLYFIIE